MPLEDGEYRFKSATPAAGRNYLTVRSSGQVFGAALDAVSEDQMWRVAKRSDGFYDITSAGAESLLRVNPPSKGDIAYTLNVRGAKDVPWDLEECHGHIVFKCTGKYAPNVMDLNTRDRIVLWDRSEQPNQLWIAENLSGGYAPIPKTLPSSIPAGPAPTSAPTPKIKPHWVTVHGANIPDNAIQGGWEATGDPLYLARVPRLDGSNSNLGTAGRHLHGICQIANCDGERVKTFNTYEVLVADEGAYKWVPTFADNLSANLSGFVSEKRTLVRPVLAWESAGPRGEAFVLRSYYNGAVLPGYTQWGIPFVERGTAVPIKGTNCEVLCYVD